MRDASMTSNAKGRMRSRWSVRLLTVYCRHNEHVNTQAPRSSLENNGPLTRLGGFFSSSSPLGVDTASTGAGAGEAGGGAPDDAARRCERRRLGCSGISHGATRPGGARRTLELMARLADGDERASGGERPVGK